MIKRLADYYYNTGLTYARKNEISAAIEKLLQSLALSRENINALNLLGLCFYRMGEYEKANKFWRESLLIEGTDNPASYYLAELEKERAVLKDLINYIQPLIAGKKYKKALRIIKKVGNISLSSISINCISDGRISFSRISAGSIINWLKKKSIKNNTSNFNTNNVKFLNYVGVLYRLSGKRKHAEEFWKKSLAIDRTNKQALDYITIRGL